MDFVLFICTVQPWGLAAAFVHVNTKAPLKLLDQHPGHPLPFCRNSVPPSQGTYVNRIVVAETTDVVVVAVTVAVSVMVDVTV